MADYHLCGPSAEYYLRHLSPVERDVLSAKSRAKLGLGRPPAEEVLSLSESEIELASLQARQFRHAAEAARLMKKAS